MTIMQDPVIFKKRYQAPSLSMEDAELCYRLSLEGISANELAEKFECSVTTVRNWMRRYCEKHCLPTLAEIKRANLKAKRDSQTNTNHFIPAHFQNIEAFALSKLQFIEEPHKYQEPALLTYRKRPAFVAIPVHLLPEDWEQRLGL